MNPAFDFLFLKDKLVPSDIIIGFGCFDLKIARHCAGLLKDGYAPLLAFTGGMGAGTMDLGEPEAIAFARVAEHLGVPKAKMIIESQSTNTPENVKFLKAILDEKRIHVRKAIISASPYRQRRVWLTCRKILPDIEFINSPPESDYCTEKELYSSKGQDFDNLLKGEIERIIRYGKMGHIITEDIPRNLC